MTSVAATRTSGAGSARRRSGPPPPPPKRTTVGTLRELGGHWNEPMPWTVVLVCVLFLILGAHNRIARAIGTAAPPTQGGVTAVSSTGTPPVAIVPNGSSGPVQAAAPLPTHAPRDPFQALVSPQGARVPVVSLPVGKAGLHAPAATSAHAPASHTPVTHSPASHPPVTHSAPSLPPVIHLPGSHVPAGASSGRPAAGSPAGTARCPDLHVVRAGESLWSIAQQHVNQTGHGNVTSYWHRIYAANQPAIGANPDLLSIGLHLCLPPANGPP